jgi:glycogen operon protein
LLSQGVPMLLAGDELGQTQNGNNNAYCQDNELSWIDWDLTDEERTFHEFVAQMVAFRRRHPVFSRRRFLKDRTLSDGVKEVAWLRPDGDEMTDAEWSTGFNRCFGVYMAGTVIERVDKRGKAVKDNNFLVLFNAHHEEIPFLLPEFHAGGAWQEVIDTANEQHPFAQKHYEAGAQYPLAGRSMAVLIATTPHPALSLRHPKIVATQPVATPPAAPAPRPTPPQNPTTTAPAPTAPQTPASASPTKPTEPLPEKLGQDSKGG